MLTYTAEEARARTVSSLEKSGYTRLDMIVKRIDNAIEHASNIGMSFAIYKISRIDWLCNKEAICDLLDLGEYHYEIKDDESGIYHEILISW